MRVTQGYQDSNNTLRYSIVKDPAGEGINTKIMLLQLYMSIEILIV